MENNENNIQSQETKKTNGISAPLVIIMLISVLIIGIGGGYLLSKNDNIFNQNKTQSNNTNNTENNTTEIQSTKVSKIEHQECSRPNHDGTFYILITAYDEAKKEVWTYKTEEGATAQYINLVYIGENNGRVYLEECGSIVALNRENGKVVWKNNEYKGYNPSVKFDSNGNVYIGSYNMQGPQLFIISKDGKTLVSNVNVEGKFGKIEIEESKNQLTACYDVPTEDVYYYTNVLTMNLSDYTYTVEKKEPEIETYERENVAGVLYIIDKSEDVITFDLQVSTAIKGQAYPNGNVNVGQVTGFAYKTSENTYEISSSNSDNSKSYSLIFKFSDDTVEITETGDYSIESGYFGLNASAPGIYKKTK